MYMCVYMYVYIVYGMDTIPNFILYAFVPVLFLLLSSVHLALGFALCRTCPGIKFTSTSCKTELRTVFGFVAPCQGGTAAVSKPHTTL